MANQKNETAKRRYLGWLRGAKGHSEQTIATVERALHQFEEFTGFKDFKTFSERQAIAFKDWLNERTTRGRPITNATKYHCLRHIQSFFSWLASQQGYRSRIDLDAVSYLSLDRRTVHEVLSPRPRRFPSLQQVKELVDSIVIRTDMDRRDRALISFLLLTGIRYQAVCSLSLGSFDPQRLVVYQDPRRGVRTKGGKAITTWVLPFDERLVGVVSDWATYLADHLKFGPADPLFPRTRVSQAEDGYSFEADTVEPEYWKGGNSVREILRTRAEKAGLPYYQPHSFRHAACQLALQIAHTPEQLKALSQNFGHEQLTTTLRSYGTLDQDRVADVIARLDFSSEQVGSNDLVSVKDLMAFIDGRKRT